MVLYCKGGQEKILRVREIVAGYSIAFKGRKVYGSWSAPKKIKMLD